jgi:hypothetical protein
VPIISTAARNNVPAVYGLSEFARVGGLLSYGVDHPKTARARGLAVPPSIMLRADEVIE